MWIVESPLIAADPAAVPDPLLPVALRKADVRVLHRTAKSSLSLAALNFRCKAYDLVVRLWSTR